MLMYITYMYKMNLSFQVPQDRTIVTRVLRTVSLPLFVCMSTISSCGIFVAIALIVFNIWNNHRRYVLYIYIRWIHPFIRRYDVVSEYIWWLQRNTYHTSSALCFSTSTVWYSIIHSTYIQYEYRIRRNVHAHHTAYPRPCNTPYNK